MSQDLGTNLPVPDSSVVPGVLQSDPARGSVLGDGPDHMHVFHVRLFNRTTATFT